MHDIVFELNIGICKYQVSEDKMQEVLECLNKLGIKIDAIEMAN